MSEVTLHGPPPSGRGAFEQGSAGDQHAWQCGAAAGQGTALRKARSARPDGNPEDHFFDIELKAMRSINPHDPGTLSGSHLPLLRPQLF